MHGDYQMRFIDDEYAALGSKPPRVAVRWSIDSDMDAIEAIDAAADRPMGVDGVRKFVKKRDAVGFTALESGRVVGFVLLVLRAEEIRVRRLAVDPDRRRHGVGSSLLAKAVSKLTTGRSEVVIPVPETCLSMQLFLKARGFGVAEILRDYHERPAESSYVFYGPFPPPRSEFLVLSPEGIAVEGCRGQ